MAMGVTASAYAANPFSDVPAGHWAYDAVAQLAAAGVVDGYGATFGGEKLMTRYEMAQIVAKAMAKGANTDKLAAEFADELDALGVRVAKLEKKVDNVKVTGQVRFDYKNHDSKDVDHTSSAGGKGFATMRTRIFVNGQINDNWSYTGMLQNQRGLTKGDNDNDNIGLKRAYLEGRIGGVKVLAGHWNEFFINDTMLDDFVDGAYAEYGVGNGKVYGMVGRNVGSVDPNPDGLEGKDKDRSRLYVAGVSQTFKAVTVALNYFKADADSGDGRGIWNLNADWAIDKDWTLTGRFMRATDDVFGNKGAVTTDVSKTGLFGQLSYKGADPAKANTWGARVRYFNQPANVFLAPTYDLTCFASDGGYSGWAVGADYVLAKNIMLQTDYYDIKSKENDKKDKTWYTQLFFFF